TEGVEGQVEDAEEIEGGVGLVACGPPDKRQNNTGQQCNTSADCNDGKVCRKGYCTASCESDSDCSEARGDTCRLGSICVNDCQKDGDCGDGYKCEKTTQSCWPEDVSFDKCDSYKDCGASEYCGKGTCLPNKCNGDADCAGQHICDGGTCVQGCRLNPKGDKQKKTPCKGDSQECNTQTNVCEAVGCSGPADNNCGQHQMCDMDQDPSKCVYTGSC
ncbi:MAG: hypothetical protein ABEN55_07225, partial [Bradymonadaceae bacterium]